MIDFAKITSATSHYNFHSHTQFCDGRADMEAMVQGAIASGLEHYGFSPHSPVPVASPCNMSRESVPEYLQEVERLRKVYGDKINLYASMEIDYFGDDWGPAHEFFRSMPLDYRIGSVHFIPSIVNEGKIVDIDGPYEGFDRKMQEEFDGDIEEVVRRFYRQEQRMIESGCFDIVGHFDKIGNNANHYCPGIEDTPWYERLVRETFEMILDKGYLIEVNTKAYGDIGRLYPNQRYFGWLKEYKLPLLVNSDAHFTHLTDAGRREAFELLKKAGVIAK